MASLPNDHASIVSGANHSTVKAPFHESNASNRTASRKPVSNQRSRQASNSNNKVNDGSGRNNNSGGDTWCQGNIASGGDQWGAANSGSKGNGGGGWDTGGDADVSW